MDKIFVVIGGIISIGFITWYFFGKKEKAVIANDEIEIKVNGGYQPENIILKKGEKTILNFLRTDTNSCLEEVVLPEFKIKKYLPMNKNVSVEILPENTGEFEISCGMSMFHGKITVRN